MALLDAPLNRQPQGLLDFFGIKSFGQYPERLGKEVQPSVDLLQWYAETNSEDLRFETNVVGTQSSGSLIAWDVQPAAFLVGGGTQVPDVEAWLVLNFTLWKNFTAVDAPGLYTHLFFPVGSPFTRWAPPQQTFQKGAPNAAVVAPDGWTVQTTVTKPFFLKPGTRISILGFGSTQAVATAIFGGMRVVRFRV